MLGFGKKKKQDAEATDETSKDVESAKQTPSSEASGATSVEDTDAERDLVNADDDEDIEGAEQAAAAADQDLEDEPDRSVTGPFDVSEIETDDSYIDLGGLRIKPDENVNMRIDVDQRSQSVVSVTFQKDGAVLQVQPFAAPKSRGLWAEVRAELAASVREQNGVVDILEGTLGRQVIAKLPASLPNGDRGYRVARFVGIDGPRWFLRGVFSGDAAVKRSSAREMERIFRSLVVVRGREPMAPRDLLPLNIPDNAVRRDPTEEEAQSLPVPERGPEITKIG
ncbi:DUF3710 domain-containing protein [Kocuria sp. HSID16901]|uniref:DUF3710 domain-containing protein n=1 Tax=Kocuria sp. HSID16901 TaxID=2419505 RepID=UPI00069FAAB0|nr:DUF3710 domain-containing protein [Kocuria sp. HSID16901]MCT1366661.1 DUF3710 domain-containing protein [Rothia sp. p3-SID1597]RUQ22736.1 DUF3710 domain-containing protein [Kocuria sp. HSID16901]